MYVQVINLYCRHLIISFICPGLYTFKLSPKKSGFVTLGKRKDSLIFGIGGIIQSHLAVCGSILFSRSGSVSSRAESECLQRPPTFRIHSSLHNWPVSKNLNFNGHKVPKFYSGTCQDNISCTTHSIDLYLI